MQNIQLRKDLFLLNVQDSKLRRFDIVMETKFGTTYNSYVIKGSEKTALIDANKDLFDEDFIRRLQSVTPIEKIDYLVVQHTEPDHSGSIAGLLRLNPNITLVGSFMAMRLVREIVNHDFKQIVVKDNDVISLGDKTLQFLSLPNLHWPDTICTYVRELKVLFTCDFFGAHYSGKDYLLSQMKDQKDYMAARRYYFDMIMSPFKTYVRAALTRLPKLDFDIVCPSHGPVIDEDLPGLMKQYDLWSELPAKGATPLVVIAFASNYGYTCTLAETIAETIKKQGLAVESYDLVVTPKETVLARLAFATGLLVGSPTIVGDIVPPVSEFLYNLNGIIHGGLYASAFGSYGWSGEAVPNILARLKQTRMKIADEGYRSRLKPDEVKLAGAREFAENFSSIVKNNS